MSIPPTLRTESPSWPRFRGVFRVLGVVLALAAIALCGRALADEWSTVRDAISEASLLPLIAAGLVASIGMFCLGALWRQCLRVFGSDVPLRAALAWYFAGELGKYLPGGVWSILGRSELARRGGVRRSTGYATTFVSYAAMCIGAAIVSGALAPFVALSGGDVGWGWTLIVLVPLGIAALHPTVLGRLGRLAERMTGGRVALQPPPLPRMVQLAFLAVPAWLLIGCASVLVTSSLGFHQHPVRTLFAAVVGWIVGFLAIPVPAGAGVREIVFVGLCGLSAGEGVAVAAGARLLLVIIDAVGGIAGLWWARRSIPTRSVAGADLAVEPR